MLFSFKKFFRDGETEAPTGSGPDDQTTSMSDGGGTSAPTERKPAESESGAFASAASAPASGSGDGAPLPFVAAASPASPPPSSGGHRAPSTAPASSLAAGAGPSPFAAPPHVEGEAAFETGFVPSPEATSRPPTSLAPAPASAALFGGDLVPDDDILKPLTWDPQFVATVDPLKMPTLVAFDDDDESQPLESLPAPGSGVEAWSSEAKSTSTDAMFAGAAPQPVAAPDGPILGAGQESAPAPISSTSVAAATAAPGLPRLGMPASGGEPVESPAVAATAASSRRPLAKGPDFVLRALLGMEGIPTCKDVIDQCGDLHGVAECLVLRSGEVVPRPEKRAAGGILAPIAMGAFEKVTSLVREIGIADADALTIQLDTRTLNFFVDDDACLAVLQEDGSTLGPGVRERLTLIAQQLATIPVA